MRTLGPKLLSLDLHPSPLWISAHMHVPTRVGRSAGGQKRGGRCSGIDWPAKQKLELSVCGVLFSQSFPSSAAWR